MEENICKHLPDRRLTGEMYHGLLKLTRKKKKKKKKMEQKYLLKKPRSDKQDGQPH